MKTPVAANGAFSANEGLNGGFASFAQTLRSAVKRVGKGLRSAIVEMQVSRMQTVLNSLPDTHVANQAVDQNELRDYARSLVVATGK